MGPGGPFGPGAPFGPGGTFGPGGFPGHVGGHGRRRGGPRARRGDVRTGILLLLAEESRSGYEIIREGRERSGGSWRPSSGSVYPMLQQLEDEGLIEQVAGEGRRRPYRLTDEGRAYLEERGEGLTPPWEAGADAYADTRSHYEEIGGLAYQLAAAASQVAQAGTSEQVERAKRLLNETRRNLYLLLAEEDVEGDDLAHALVAKPTGTLAGPAADLQDPGPGDVTEQPGTGLVDALRRPDEPDVAQEVAVLELVGVGGPVPPATPRSGALLGRHRTPFHPAGCRVLRLLVHAVVHTAPTSGSEGPVPLRRRRRPPRRVPHQCRRS